MNFDQRINDMESSIKSCLQSLEIIKTDLAAATEFTAKFLDECERSGIKRVGVGRLPKNKTWTFGPSGSVFTFGGERDKSGCPAIWGVVTRLKISNGAGNSDQHQANLSNLIDGVYELREGNWRKMD